MKKIVFYSGPEQGVAVCEINDEPLELIFLNVGLPNPNINYFATTLDLVVKTKKETLSEKFIIL
jgi:hypothetical protein